MKQISEYLLSKNTKLKSYHELNENMSFEDFIDFFNKLGYKTNQCGDSNIFFDQKIKEREIFIIRNVFKKYVRFRLDSNIYMFTFMENRITEISVMQIESGNHYKVPSKIVGSIKSVINKINNSL